MLDPTAHLARCARVVRARWSLLPLILALASCGETRRPTSPTGPAKPSCTLPVCAPCDCDMSTACDMGCSACDPECGNCRAEGAECTMPRDAGPASTGDGAVSSDGGTLRPDTGPRPDAGPCMFPASQGLSQPCCLDRGVDACGAGLFCEAFDGRTQPTCYAQGSRRDGETCGADNHCAGGRCPGSSGRCGPALGDPCSPAGQACAPDDAGGTVLCHPIQERCVSPPCDPGTHQPCSSGASCYVTAAEPPMAGDTSCAPTGTNAAGTACAVSSDCQRDLICFRFQAQGVCVETCFDGTCTNANTTCATPFGDVPLCAPR